MDKDKVTQESEIKIKVGLNEEKVPVAMHWQADDNPANDVGSSNFYTVVGGEDVNLALTLDCWGSETTPVVVSRKMMNWSSITLV